MIFLRGQSPTKGENQKVRISKTSREGDMAKPGPVSGLQLFTRLPSLMAITCRCLCTYLHLLISSASSKKRPLFSASLIKDKAVFFPLSFTVPLTSKTPLSQSVTVLLRAFH